MNKDGCRNCKYMERTGLAKVMRCSLDSDMINPDDICSNYKLKKIKPKTK